MQTADFLNILLTICLIVNIITNDVNYWIT